MTPQVLIFASQDDAHATAVGWALRQGGADVVLAPSVRTDEETRMAVWVGDGGFTINGTMCSQERNLRSVWYRRPKSPEAGTCHEADRGFIAGQWLRLQNNVFGLAENLLDALWVNNPDMATRAENKLVQMHAARQVGLDLPDTLISNDVHDVRVMLQRWPHVVFKTFYPYNWKSASTGNMYNIGVKLLDASSELPEKSIAMCPGIFQRYIEKAYDVRVTVIGDRYFSVRMQRSDGTAYVDWRKHMMDEDLFIEEWPLPAHMENKLRALMHKLGLAYGCIDLVVDPDGGIYFLEVNQAGQFLFVEEALPSMPLLAAMTAMLGTGRRDYALSGSESPRFVDYMRTDDYQAMVERQIHLLASTESRAVEA
jgi:glutathione synthase/RimK-type ligase-like ATP-grasp enzyme